MIPGEEQGSLLSRLAPFALAWAIGLSVLAGGAWLLVTGGEYYALPAGEQALHRLDPLLRSSGRVGLWLGVGAAGLMVLNVLYLVRRNLKPELPLLGSPRAWMTIHVATGLAAPVVALFHSSFTARTPLGVSALAFLGCASLAGIVGRYLYSVVPRGASGRELKLAQVREAAQRQLAALERELGAAPEVESEVRALLDEVLAPARGGWIGARILRLVRDDLHRRRALRRLRARLGGQEQRRLADMTEAALLLRHQVQRHDELHGLMSTWRGAHRWLAMCAALLLLGHIWVAVTWAPLL